MLFRSCKPADEIIESAYQIVIKDEITVFCRECSPKLTDRLFVGMPSRKTVDGGFADMVHPIFAGAREVIEVPVLDAYAAYVAQMTE